LASDPSAPSATVPVVSIILATFNERASLPGLLERIFALATAALEVIVIDDGSVDGTREFVTELAQREPRLRTIFHDGKQTTLRAQGQGIASAQGRFVIVMDADLQHPPETIPEMVRRLEQGASLAVASRYALGGSPGPRTLRRRFYSRGAEMIAKISLREARRISDPVSGYFGFRREVFVPLDPEIRGYKLLLFVLVMNAHRPVAEVGFRFEPRAHGQSKTTQGLGFIPLFLAETYRARRFGRSLRSGRSPPETPLAPHS
jgi:dolichol-phosphate mannosyltransferase